MSDSAAFHEVDNAVRQDEIKAWWKRYGTLTVSGVVVLVVAVAAVVGWRQYQFSQRAAAGEAYTAALAKIGQDNAAARAELDKLAASAVDPYRWLAAMTAAQLQDKAEDRVAALQAVAPKLPDPMNELAQVIAGFQSVDTPKGAETIASLEPLAAPNHAFHGSVLELQSLEAQRKGDLKRARELWAEIVKDPTAPPGAIQRAQALLNFTDEQGAK
ncbi:hypothetical protein SAMN02745126_01698 [Enhydrobacter aerosaccus]|uniref:Ancillary SecYEG translocon subunit/Cell division coordinator CpoB TPR domain-containing protein n=1 Tax=Enhydrobacter aerosaccus TaxID=225324 RepID=A0A1T4LSX3_9HYPH|nr:tetratricopeptide repeat protein [Enhydrobacter aerosaccus]SJZ57803.1 hypothetical protein SAMN02745126_01698 [Enhydrobacter aerosaccus]